MENIIKMSMNAPLPEAQAENDPDLFGKLMHQIPIWDYSSISKASYTALANFEKEKLIRNYYSDMKSRGCGKFSIIFFIMPNWRQFKLKDSVKFIWMQAESKVMQGCFYCGKCKNCNKFVEIENK